MRRDQFHLSKFAMMRSGKALALIAVRMCRARMRGVCCICEHAGGACVQLLQDIGGEFARIALVCHLSVQFIERRVQIGWQKLKCGRREGEVLDPLYRRAEFLGYVVLHVHASGLRKRWLTMMTSEKSGGNLRHVSSVAQWGIGKQTVASYTGGCNLAMQRYQYRHMQERPKEVAGLVESVKRISALMGCRRQGQSVRHSHKGNAGKGGAMS